MIRELKRQGELSKKPCVIVFTKEGCAVCETLAKKIDAAVGGNIDVFIIRYETHPQLFEVFDVDPDKLVRSPIALILKHGKVVDEIVKGTPQPIIAKKIINAKKAR